MVTIDILESLPSFCPEIVVTLRSIQSNASQLLVKEVKMACQLTEDQWREVARRMMTEGERRLETLVLGEVCDIDKVDKEVVAAVVCGVKEVKVGCQLTEEQWRSVEERLETALRKIETLTIYNSENEVRKLQLHNLNKIIG